ncbi:hypothetical protein GCM10010967_59060 [Dyadobacter beijingensis]|uniref:DUF5672 domain-containing protein n=1 Tax=Dyadobacter beijingensis TaxID=365489 RepID=A0ABQ2INR7_9BACT|nr:DUF5672 family protein [Dyadobacter beijingensis]GGN14767.1 hypothetical protein GCM10010967_59060 [Dyadobacter beijingensis]
MADNKSLVAVVIPVYQSAMTDAEQMSLKQCMAVLGNYPVVIAKPASLDLTALRGEYPALAFESFEDSYFKSVDAYNRLMTSIDFYKTFTAYEYILIYQLDAFVFRDELTAWCAKGYDYIGAPSLHQPKYDTVPAGSAQIFADALSTQRVVLNGGLSLRRIPAFLRYLKIYNTFYPAWKGNEDMLFCQEATRLKPLKIFMTLPKWPEALRFAFEKSPAASYELTHHELPFACHAWERYEPSFWARFIAVNQ